MALTALEQKWQEQEAQRKPALDDAYDKEGKFDPQLIEGSVLSRLPRPTGWRIAILPYRGAQKTKGGIALSEETQKRTQVATTVGDVWLAHVQGGTSVSWIDQFGSTVFDYPSALAPGDPGTVFAAGYTYGTFAPVGGGFDDAWLARYDLCYPDCNGDGALTVQDFGCFQTRFVAADLYADCNADGVLTVQDFGCFQTKFVQGCP